MATPELRDLCLPFAHGLLDKARALDKLELTKHQTAGFVTSMSVDIRKLCDITVPSVILPEVSQSATDLAEAIGIDLRMQTYQSQPMGPRSLPLVGMSAVSGTRGDPRGD